MKKDNTADFHFSLSVFAIPLCFTLAMWAVFWAERKYHIDLTVFGIYPRTFSGLSGVIFSPFLHGNIEHLYNNTFPLLILLAVLRYFYRDQTFKILGFGIVFSGLLTWIIGRESYHIGASSLIYVLVSFIFFKGILTRYYRLVALSLIIVLLYGSLIWYVFPNIEKGISWEGHLSGFIVGLFFAFYFKTPEYKKLLKYDWEQPNFDPRQDKFMQRFDENGNFVNLPEPEIEEQIAPQNIPYFTTDENYVYDFKSSKPKP